MKKKKGFTLIELLAVIVILAVIALIATPAIINVIENARKKAFENTAYGVLEGLRLNYTERILSGTTSEEQEFTFPNSGLKLSGEEPAYGEAKIDGKGNISFVLADKDKKWCAKKDTTSEKVTIEDYEESNCVIEVKKYTEVIDLSNKNNNGKINGPIEFSNGEAIFNGKDTYIDAGYANYNFTNGITVVSRFKINVTSSINQAIIGNWQTAGGGIIVNKTQVPGFYLYSESIKNYYAAMDNSNTIEIGRYYTMVGVYDNNNLKLYIDGNLVKTIASQDNVKASDVPFCIGTNCNVVGAQEFANATITDSILYSSPISEEEVKNKYSSKIEIQNDDRILFQYKYEDKYLK